MQVSKLFAYLSLKYLKHDYHYGMTKADFINRFKNHNQSINIGGKNHVAYADDAFQQSYCKQQCFNTEHAQNNTGVVQVCQIEFTL